MKRGTRITELFVFIALDSTDGCERIPAFAGPHMDDIDTKILVPMVVSDKERLLSLINVARDMRQKTGNPIRLVRFTIAEEIQEI